MGFALLIAVLFVIRGPWSSGWEPEFDTVALDVFFVGQPSLTFLELRQKICKFEGFKKCLKLMKFVTEKMKLHK